MMNHHTIPKFGFGPYKSSSTGVGSFFLPKILTNPTDRNCPGAEAVAAAGPSSSKVALELTHGSNKQIITLPSEKLDSNKRYYVTFTLNKPDSQQAAEADHAPKGTDPTHLSLLSPTGKSAEGQPQQSAGKPPEAATSATSISHSAAAGDAQNPQQQHRSQLHPGLPAVVEEDSNLDSSSSGPSPAAVGTA